MIITSEKFKLAFPKCQEPELWAAALHRAAERWVIDTPVRVAHWLGQLAHESQEFNRVEENLNYNWGALMRTWPRRFPDKATAMEYAHNPEELANYVYGNRMGNRNEVSGDGWKYHGRGPAMLTGQINYAAATTATGLPLLDHPELAREKGAGSMIAAWFWNDKRLNKYADAGDIEEITERWNGALLGHAERRAYTETGLKVFA